MEFLLVLGPLVALASSTIGLIWYAFERSTIRVIGAEAAWMLAQPDVEPKDLQDFVAARLRSELGMERFDLESEKLADLATVRISIDQLPLPGLMGIEIPQLTMEHRAAQEG